MLHNAFCSNVCTSQTIDTILKTEVHPSLVHLSILPVSGQIFPSPFTTYATCSAKLTIYIIILDTILNVQTITLLTFQIFPSLFRYVSCPNVLTSTLSKTKVGTFFNSG